MHLYQIVYTSRNCILGTPEQIEAEIASILNTSRKNNGPAGITGALLFNGHGFAQVLEGPVEAVEATYERIQCDPRHSDVVLLNNGETAERTFSDWSMAYADPETVRSGEHEPIRLDEICADRAKGGARIVRALHELLATELV